MQTETSVTPPFDNLNIGVIGLGYVGLHLAVEFGKHFHTIGFDINETRINELNTRSIDRNLEIGPDKLRAAAKLSFTMDPDSLGACNVFVVAVPTPVDEANQPDLAPLEAASTMIGRALKKGDVVIYESTVYPGTTQEKCVPLLENTSGLKHKQDFFCGYSPERINPGDKTRQFINIKKITSGSTPESAEFVDLLYRKIIAAGTYKAPSIKVAEAAKVVENIQRDVNIALMNELAMIFATMGVDTLEVLKAAGTKWNFLHFHPGLVGGHCIGVDPYYLTHKATTLGYHPELTLAARRINDRMGIYVANQVMRLMAHKRIDIVDSHILVLGLTFKEDCPDLRNTKVIDIVRELTQYHAHVDVHDPWADPDETQMKFGIGLIEEPKTGAYDAVILAVPHETFKALGAIQIRAYGKSRSLLFDAKGVLDPRLVDGRI